jgi:hypothetical protein
MPNLYEITHHMDTSAPIEADSEGEALDAWARTQKYGYSNTYPDFREWAMAHRFPSDPYDLIVAHARARIHVKETRIAPVRSMPHVVTHEIVGGVSYGFPVGLRCY